MKQKTFFSLVTVFLLIAASGCSSLGKSENGESAETGTDSVSEEVKLLPDGWSYETEITHEGSRSEGSVSRLFYRYNEIPAAYDRLIIGDSIFNYKSMVNIWDDSGYIKTGQPAEPPAVSGAVTQEELKRGWYLSAYSEKKAGTPKGWIWGEGARISVWISPALLNDFANLYNLKAAGGSPELLRTE